MAQLQSPVTYVNGDQVTASNLNNHVNGAIILAGVVTDQTAMTANTVATGDTFLVYDASATALRKTTAGDILNSGLALTTASITGAAASDIIITPQAGQKVDVAGNIEADDVHVTDDLTVADDATISGDLVVTGGSTLTGNVIADNGFTSNGTANFTGSFQFNGSAAYALSEIVEENIPNATGAAASTLHSLFTSASYTKPSGEFWVIEIEGALFAPNNGTYTHYRLTDSTDTTKYALGYFYNGHTSGVHMFNSRFYIAQATTFSGTFVFRAKSTQGNISVTPTGTQLTTSYPDNTEGTTGKFRIYKYKTA